VRERWERRKKCYWCEGVEVKEDGEC